MEYVKKTLKVPASSAKLMIPAWHRSAGIMSSSNGLMRMESLMTPHRAKCWFSKRDVLPQHTSSRADKAAGITMRRTTRRRHRDPAPARLTCKSELPRKRYPWCICSGKEKLTGCGCVVCTFPFLFVSCGTFPRYSFISRQHWSHANSLLRGIHVQMLCVCLVEQIANKNSSTSALTCKKWKTILGNMLRLRKKNS